jgi:Ca2+-binding EF-hand superfamily protein
MQSPKTALLLASGITASVTGAGIREIFDLLDANKNGFIDQAEAVVGLEKFSASLAEETSVLANELFCNADLDGDGQISFQEFSAFLDEAQRIRAQQYEFEGESALGDATEVVKIADHTQEQAQDPGAKKATPRRQVLREQPIPMDDCPSKPADKQHIMSATESAGTGEWSQEDRAVAAAVEHQEGSEVGLTTLKGRLADLLAGDRGGGGGAPGGVDGGSGTLTEATFTALLEELRLFDGQHDLRRRIFQRFDTDSNGNIDLVRLCGSIDKTTKYII